MSTNFSFGNLFFWLFLVGASASAFGAGFWYTYGATANVNIKSPGADNVKPIATPAVAAAPKATPTATVQPGLLDMPSMPPTATPAPAEESQAAATPHFVEPATPRPATPQPTPEAEIFRVQVGPFDDRLAAERQVQELQGSGINAVVVYDQGRYHAQLGAFSDRARAISVADEVNQRGYSVTIRH